MRAPFDGLASGRYVLDASTLALAAGLARPLALDGSAIGRAFGGLRAEAVDGSTGTHAFEGEGLKVGLVAIQGPIAQRAYYDLCAVVDGYDAVVARFAAALEAADAVVLVIDSPGGDGAGLLEAVRRMRAMADEAKKPVVAFADEWAASAAYWIAMGVADEVYLPAMGAIGSIGAIAVHADMSGAAEKEGVAYTVVRDPAGKAAGMSLEPLSDTGRARIERGVSALASAFVDAVAARRGLTAAAVRAMNADMFTGAAAVRAGLADRVGSLEDAVERAAAMALETNGAGERRVSTSAPAQETRKMSKAEKAAALGISLTAYKIMRDGRKAAAQGLPLDAYRALKAEKKTARGGGGAGTLTAEERSYAAQFGIEPGALASHKRSLAATEASRSTSHAARGAAYGLTEDEARYAAQFRIDPAALATFKATGKAS